MTKPAALSSSKRKRIAQRFGEAVNYQRAGNAVEAERCFAQVVALAPGHAQALHHLALLLQRRGEAGEALALMRRAVQCHDVDASMFNNLANMLREAGCAEDAVAVYRQAVKHDPGNLNAQFNLAGMLLNSGDAEGAKAAFEQVLRAAPRDAGALHGMGHALLALGDADAAAGQFQALVDVVPDEPAAYVSLCGALLAADCAAQALSTVTAALARLPNAPALLQQQAEVQMILGDYDAAEHAYEAWRAIDTDNVEACLGLGRCLVEHSREVQAIGLCADITARFGELADVHMIKGAALKQLGRFDEAALELERTLALEPDLAEAWNNLGMIRVDLGEMSDAQQCFERALSLQPELANALFNLTRMRRTTEDQREQLERIEAMAMQRSRPVEERVALRFTLGKAFDDLGDADRAFPHYVEGNALKARSMPFDAPSFRSWAQSLHTTYSAAYFRRCAGFGVASERPVFIVGMPRSGTTLVEQILASHPQVFGAGELTFIIDYAASLHKRLGVLAQGPTAANFLTREVADDLGHEYLAATSALGATSTRCTDKMPNNFWHLGLIKSLLPNARVIHCVRDPMDSCFSNFIQLFGEAHDYSYNLQHIAVFYNEYQRIMAHWQDVLPLAMHTVSYEALVDDTRTQTAAMLDFLDLPFDEACLEFHRTRRAVGTASNWQVRQPIYRSSRLRWRRYAAHLGELASAIGYDMNAADF